MKKLHTFRFVLLVYIASMFGFDIYRRVADYTHLSENYHQLAVNVAFRSAFGLFELAVIGIMLFFIAKYPLQRLRLGSLVFFHIVGVLMVPMITRDASWMALSFPWPQTLLAFDSATPAVVMVSSCIVGFGIIPCITLICGRKAFCGYVCPLGGFYSESLGRLFTPPHGRMKLLRRFGPPVNLLLMSVALASVLLFPSTLSPIRTGQKLLFFMLSQVLYFVVGIPLVGARSYCTHLCPLGYGIGWLVRYKNRRTASAGSLPKTPSR